MPLTKIAADGKAAIQVRSLVVIILVIGSTAGFFKGIVSSEAYMGLVMFCVGYYFGKRGEADAITSDRAITAPNSPPPNEQ